MYTVCFISILISLISIGISVSTFFKNKLFLIPIIISILFVIIGLFIILINGSNISNQNVVIGTHIFMYSGLSLIITFIAMKILDNKCGKISK